MKKNIIFSLFFICSFVFGNDEPPIMPIQPARINQTWSGFTRAIQTIDIVSEVSAHVLKVNYQMGDFIKEDPFCKLDPIWVDLDLQKAQAVLDQADQTLSFYEKDFIRAQKLIIDSRISQFEYDQKENQFLMQTYQTKWAQAERDRLLELTKRHQIFAPMGWKIISRLVEPGSYVTPGQVLARVGDFKAVVVEFLVDPIDLAFIQKQKTYAIFFPDFGIKLPAENEKWDPSYDSVTRKRHIFLKVNLPQGSPIYGGVLSELTLKDQTIDGLWMVNESFVSQEYEEAFIIDHSGVRHTISIAFQKGSMIYFYSKSLNDQSQLNAIR